MKKLYAEMSAIWRRICRCAYFLYPSGRFCGAEPPGTFGAAAVFCKREAGRLPVFCYSKLFQESRLKKMNLPFRPLPIDFRC